jgi:hypothetical protein
MVLDQWSDIGAKIKAIRDGNEIPSTNPMEVQKEPDAPTTQDSDMSL